MKINEFYDYKSYCPFCQSSLTKEASVSVAISQIAINTTAELVIIKYDYHDPTFKSPRLFKHRFHPPCEENQWVHNTVLEHMPPTLSPQIVFKPKIKVRPLNKAIHPLSFQTTDIVFERQCT